MSFRYSRLASSPLTLGVLVVAAGMFLPGSSWAVFYPLGPSKDEWGLKLLRAVENGGAGRPNLVALGNYGVSGVQGFVAVEINSIKRCVGAAVWRPAAG